MGAAGEAKESGDKAAVASERQTWRDRALQFLKKRGCSDEGTAKARKRHRVTAFAWCLAVDSALRVGTGEGLARFKRQSDGALSPLAWPRLSLAPDQGTDGLAALSYLMYDQGINVDYTPDTSHGMWRDVQLSIKRCGHWSFLLLLVSCFNIFHGPFEEDRFSTSSKRLCRSTSWWQTRVPVQSSSTTCPTSCKTGVRRRGSPRVALRLLSGRTKYVLLVGTLLVHYHVDVLLSILLFGCYLQWSMIKLPALVPTCLC